jgi:HEAT repeat protein
MKRFLSSVALCLALLLVGLFFFLPSTGAQNNARRAVSPEVTLKALLEMPAPPPPNPFYKPSSNERDEFFLDKKNPPSDNASIEDLVDYWKHQNQYNQKYTYTPKASEKTIERLMAEVEKKPELLSELVDTFPESKETAEFVKRFYDEHKTSDKLDESWKTEVKQWLTYHSPYYSNELYQTANQAAETKEYVTNQDEVLALARVDWEKAKPILDRMLSNSNAPVSQTLARWAYYKHAVAVNDSFDIEKYRKELQETVENKSLQPGNRDLAMDALVAVGDFPGRDDWYYSLLEDETLYELRVNGQVYTGLTTIINHSPDDKYVAKMVELAASSNQTVRNAAVRNLSVLLDDPITKQNPDIIRALVPWLENPNWAKEVNGERLKIVTALRNFVIPESVPGLIGMLNERDRRVAANSNTSVYAGNTSLSNTAAVSAASYPFRSYAIMALEKQRSPQAAAPLRQLVSVVENWERQGVVRAALVSNGFTVSEQIEALEKVAKQISQQPAVAANMASNGAVIDSTTYTSNSTYLANTETYSEPVIRVQPSNQNDIGAILGLHLVNLDEPGEELVKAVIDRIGIHEKRDPQLAEALRGIIQNWKGAAINALLLRDLRDGKANMFAIVKLLTLRKELREKQLNDVTDARSGSATALGVAACLLEQPDDYESILNGESVEAKTALFGCARLIRAPLTVEKVAAHLKSENKTLALAAERYLESEDSPEARRIVLALHPNEAKILGARVAFTPDGDQSAAFAMPFTRELFVSVDPLFRKFEPYYFYGVTDDETEKKLQTEIKENAELWGVYAYDNNFVRIYRDRVVFSWQDDPARYRERVLSGEEFELLKNYFAGQRVDELPPFLSACQGCTGKELLMLGKGGGRRVFVKADPQPQFFADLDNIFAEFRKPPSEVHYYLEKSVAGLEVLFADENQSVATLWKSGADFRLLIDDVNLRRQYEQEAEKAESEASEESETEESTGDEETESSEVLTPEQKAKAEKRRLEEQRIARQKEYGSYTWFGFDKTKLLEPVAQPAGVEFIPLVDGFAVQPNEQQWKARAAGVEVRTDEEGLYRIKGTQFTKLGSGYYNRALVTPNGRWAIATKYSEEEDASYALVRVNLLTGREYKIKIESDYGAAEPVANLPVPGKVLLFSSYSEGEEESLSEREGEFLLLDVETGITRPLGADARPLLQQTFRALQPSGASADLLWAAIPDSENSITEVGVFNARTFTFKPLLKLPQIVFGSMDMWVDEAEGKFYFVYNGHLLALPLPKNR